MPDLSGLFSPARVAVVGATDRDGSVGLALMENLSAFEGEVVPVNPNRETVLGMTCYPTVGDVPDAASIDAAVVLVPADVAVDVVRDLGEVGVTNVVVISAGFAESGEEGARRERQLASVARRYDMNLVGPNCLGVISTGSGLNATFVRTSPPAGPLSLMSQSGAFISAVLAWATRGGVGFNDVVSLGNEAVLDELDFLEEWGDDPDTDVVLAYLEDVEDGRRFIDTARAVTAHTPVVVIKSGRTEAGRAAAASHTGAIAGREQAYRAAFRQAGVLRADGVQEVFDVGQTLAHQPPLEGDDVAIVTNGGGPGVLAADAVAGSRLALADFDGGLRSELARSLPPAAGVSNPLDIVGDADLGRFEEALSLVAGSETVDGVLVMSVPTALFAFDELAATIGGLAGRYGKPVVTCLMGGEDAERAAQTLAGFGIPNFFEPGRAVRSLEALADYREVTRREYEAPARFDVDSDRAAEVLGAADARGTLGVEAMELLGAYGIRTPAGELATSASEAQRIAADIGGPVVLKVASPALTHKSDVGGVELDVPVDEVREAYAAVRDRVRRHVGSGDVIGVRVEEYVDRSGSTETIVGLSRDPQFGHVVMFGLGGIFVQIFEDTSFRIAPVSGREAREMTADIRAAPMLRGARGRPPADLDAIVEVIQRVSQLAMDFPVIEELDVNPLIAGPDGACAADLRLTVNRDATSA